MKKEDVKVFGNYYVQFKRRDGIPSRVTILERREHGVILVEGHYTKQSYSNSLLHDKHLIPYNKIQSHLSKDKEKLSLKYETEAHEEFERCEHLVERIFADFDIKIPFLSWFCMSEEELQNIYNDLSSQKLNK